MFNNPESLNKLIKENIDAWRFFQASFLTQNLLSWYLKNNQNWINKDQIEQTKKQLIELNQKSENEYIRFESKVEIPWDIYQKMIQDLIDEKDDDILFWKLAYDFLISLNKIKEETLSNASPMMFLSDASVVDLNGHINKAKSPIEHREKQNYLWRVQIQMQLLNDMFFSLVQKWRITNDSLISYLLSKPLFGNASSFQKTAHGLWRLFEKDLVSSIHILIPVLEDIILSVSKRLGINTISLPRNEWWLATRDIIINDVFFENDEVKNILSEDFCYQISFLLYDKLWFWLRQKIAHWGITYEESFSGLVIIPIRILLFLASSIEVSKNDKSNDK